MARRILVNAIHEEEIRIAITDNEKLVELEVERGDHTQLKGNIYKANIARIEPSLQAAFLDIGSNRNGFLQINDIHPSYFNDWKPEDYSYRNRPSIQDMLNAGQNLVVQVVKDEREAKGATLTTNLSIPGRYLVLTIGNQRGGVSRKIVDESQRRQLRDAVSNLKIPPGMGVIVRTAGINKSSSELQQDLDHLLEIWDQILQGSKSNDTPQLLYKESDLALRTIRDYANTTIDEILVDEENTFNEVKKFIEKSMPEIGAEVKLYKEAPPLFSYYRLDDQIDEINQSEVTLPTGGSIVINLTEAFVSVDVNSGRSTGQADVEETAFNTNKEAAIAVARQLRLRDLGGLVVIDFIDMLDRKHKQVVERTLKDALKEDKAKIEVGRISKFGLLEMSRQRLRSSLTSQSYVVCPHCKGSGKVKTPESAALEALRKIQSAVFAGGVKSVRIRTSPAPALLLLNEKRQLIARLEKETGAKILVYADGRMSSEEYELEIETDKSSFIQSRTNFSHNPNEEKEGSDKENTDKKRPYNKRGSGKQRKGYNKRNRNNSSGKKDSRSGSYRSRRKNNKDESDAPKSTESKNGTKSAEKKTGGPVETPAS